MKILINNLQRTGDILQSFPLIISIKEKYPNSEIFYLTNSIHSQALELIDKYLSKIFIIKYEKLYFLLKNDFNSAFHYLKSFFNTFPFFDKVINLNFSKLGAIVTSLISAKEKIGAELSSCEYISIKEPLIKEAFLNLDNKKYKSHLLEPFFLTLGISYIKRQFNINKKIKKVVFHIGASRNEKKWGNKNFVKLGYLLKKRFNIHHIYFTGTLKEMDDIKICIERLKNMGVDAINLAGKMTLKELFVFLKNIDLVISGDTSIQHLAALTDILAIAIFLGNAYHYHTFPYGINKVVFYPEVECYPCLVNYNCKRSICKNSIYPEQIINFLEGKKVNNVMVTTYENGLIKLKKIKYSKILKTIINCDTF